MARAANRTMPRNSLSRWRTVSAFKPCTICQSRPSRFQIAATQSRLAEPEVPPRTLGGSAQGFAETGLGLLQPVLGEQGVAESQVGQKIAGPKTERLLEVANGVLGATPLRRENAKIVRPVGIAGVGHCLPDWVVDNHYFTRFIETSDDWIRQRTGISERRWIRDDERPSDLFVNAGTQALERAGIAPEEVDMVVVGTVSGDYTCPATACIVQDRMGCKNAAAFDIAAACTGFLYSLSIGQNAVRMSDSSNDMTLGLWTRWTLFRISNI